MTMVDDTKAEVMAVLSKYAEGYSNKDLKTLMALTAKDYIGFGSGLDDNISSRDKLSHFLKRDFSQCGDLSMKFAPTYIEADGKLAWVTGNCTIEANIGDEKIRSAGRMTIILRKVRNKWLFAHTHFSAPMMCINLSKKEVPGTIEYGISISVPS